MTSRPCSATSNKLPPRRWSGTSRICASMEHLHLRRSAHQSPKRSGVGAQVQVSQKYLARYGYTLALNRHGDHWIITDADAVQAATFEIYWAAALTCIEEYYFA